jgi:hypothetical protein
MHPDGPPDEQRDAPRFGAWIENACLASALNRGQRVTYWREEPLEVDDVLEGSWGSWAAEIKSAGFHSLDNARPRHGHEWIGRLVSTRSWLSRERTVWLQHHLSFYQAFRLCRLLQNRRPWRQRRTTP